MIVDTDEQWKPVEKYIYGLDWRAGGASRPEQ
jgi:hypothetical protein